VLEVQDAFGNRVSDDATHVTFTPAGGAAISGVATGTGDGAYGAPGEPEQVTVSAGIVSITLGGMQIGTFSVSFANSAGLQNPPADVIVTEEIADTVLIGHGNPDDVVSRYDAQTGQSEVALDLIAPSRDVAADARGNIYTTREVFVGPGFETDLARNGIVVDTFPGAPGGLAVDLFTASVLVGHGDGSGIVSRYDTLTGQSSAVLALSAPTRDVAVDWSGDIYTTSEVFVDPGFETDLARNGVVVDTFPGAPGGLAVDLSTDMNGDTAPDTSVLVGHGNASGVVSRFDPGSGQSNPVLTLSGIVEDVVVNSTGDIYTTSEIPSGPGFDTRLLENGLDADLLSGEPGGLAVVPLPEPGSAALLAGLGLLFALRRR
jgi:hypothetical protein